MTSRISPGRDAKANPVSGVSRDGQPLPLSRAPAADLAPWISRLFVTTVDAPDDHVIDCGVFNDTCYIRVLLRGRWSAETAAGRVDHDRGALFFGPQSRRMPVRVQGPFDMIGFGLRPGAVHALGGPAVARVIDRVVPLAAIHDIGGLDRTLTDLDTDKSDALLMLEEMVRAVITRNDAALPDPITTRFDHAAFSDPTFSVEEFARETAVEQRRLVRLVKRDFGLTPKQVLRRARVLDMASDLRGVADDAESEALAMRYYDQSHLIREFVGFMGQTPRQFVLQPQPIMTLTLEVRQSRRLEALGRLPAGAPRPWENEALDRYRSFSRTPT